MNCALALSLLLAAATTTVSLANTCKESISVNTPVSEWRLRGQINDHFTLLEFEGVEVGIRVQERGVPNPLTPTETTVDGYTIGVYRVETGSATDGTDTDLSWWNLDLFIDVRNADDINKQTIADYSGAPPGGGAIGLTVECVAGSCGTFGTYEYDFAPAEILPPTMDRLPASQNPNSGFWPWNDGILANAWGNLEDIPGDDSYDMDAEATYKFCLQLGTYCPVCNMVSSQAPSSSGAPSGVPSGVPSILPTLSGKPSMVSCCRAIWKYTCTFLMSII